MKAMPTVIASPRRDVAIAVLEFQEAHPIPNRDATGFYYVVQRSPAETKSRVAVVFSGTVFFIDTEAFGLPSVPDKEQRFTAFAEAAIGDYLDEHGLPDHTPSGVSAAQIECFSPHFQSWHDRSPATDEEIEEYLRKHLLWSWRFAQDGWELGPADSLRLHQPLKIIQRLVSVGEGRDWTVSQRPHGALWLKPTPSFLRDMRDASKAPRPKSTDKTPSDTSEDEDVTPQPPPEYVFVDEVRIADLRRVASPRHDLRKLIALCEELNQCYRSQCYHAVAALIRALLDHVPPIFAMPTFTEVANNYAGTKSFKEVMQHLDAAARKIADMHLHTKVRERESLPSRTQVSFSPEVDVLLAEIVRILGTP